MSVAVVSCSIWKDDQLPCPPPEQYDYVQLLDAEGNPSENFVEVQNWNAWLGGESFLITTVHGESYAITRLPDFDNAVRRAWQQTLIGGTSAKENQNGN